MLSWDTLFKLMRLKRAVEEGRVNVKEWYKSKTVWLNLSAILGIIGTMATGDVTTAVGIPALITAIINLGLRFVTTTGIGTPAGGQ
jgi:hypothetical protein